MPIIIAIILVIIFFPVLIGIIPLIGVLLIFGGLIYGVLMVMKMISMATGHYHYGGNDINKINKTFGMNWGANDFNRKLIEPNQIKTNITQNDKRLTYLSRFGFIKNGVKVPHIIIKYFGGNYNIDKHGDFNNKDFYFYVNDHNVLFMLTVNFFNKEAFYSLRNQELEYYTISPDKTMTIITTLEGEMKENIHLSSSAYDVMLKHYPTKALKYINQQKIV